MSTGKHEIIFELRKQLMRKQQNATLLIDLRERSLVRVGLPRVNFITLYGEDIEEFNDPQSINDDRRTWPTCKSEPEAVE